MAQSNDVKGGYMGLTSPLKTVWPNGKSVTIYPNGRVIDQSTGYVVRDADNFTEENKVETNKQGSYEGIKTVVVGSVFAAAFIALAKGVLK